MKERTEEKVRYLQTVGGRDQGETEEDEVEPIEIVKNRNGL